jgi:putative ABC transport system permease protein
VDTFQSILSDLGTGIRTLAKRPLYSALCLATLALGLGTSVAMFAVVHAVLIRPLPVLNQDRLVFVTKHPRNDRQVLPFSFAEQTAVSHLSGIVETSGGVQYDGPLAVGLRVGRLAFNVNATSVTADFFAVLGSRAELGRLTIVADRPASSAVVISRRLWKTRFGGDSTVVGRSVRLGETVIATIIGIAPARFDFPHGSDAWYLLQPPAGKEAEYAWFSGVVRLRPGTSLERARLGVQLIVARDTTQGVMVAEVRPFLDAAIGNLRSSVLILSVAAGLVFLVAIANAASLLLVQGSARARELAIRGALGASRARVVRLLTIEAGLLAAGAVGLGAVLTLLVLRALAVLTPTEVARVGEVEASPALLAALSLAATAAVLLFGALPALWLSRRSPFGALRSARAGVDALGGSGRIRELLVTVQVALAVIVAAGAGLMIRTIDNLNRLDLGVDRAQLTVIRVTPGAATNTPAVQFFYEQLAERVAAAPGVQSASAITSQPFMGWRGWTTTFTLPQQDAKEAARNPWADLEVVGTDFFRTLGVRLLRGRPFDHADRVGQPRRVIVNETLARLAWPGQDPIGRRLMVGAQAVLVVGLAGDTRFRELTSSAPTIYVSLAQADSALPILPGYLAVRSELRPDRVAAVVGNAARELAADAIVFETTSMGQAIQGQLARPRFSASLLTGFAGVTLLLVGAGLFATISALVQQRTREIGVRIALGARPVQLGRYILRRGLRIAAIGLVAGLAFSLLATRLIRRLLFGIQSTDPLVLLLTAAIITTIAVVACLAPTVQAARIDPMVSLRED